MKTDSRTYEFTFNGMGVCLIITGKDLVNIGFKDASVTMEFIQSQGTSKKFRGLINYIKAEFI